MNKIKDILKNDGLTIILLTTIFLIEPLNSWYESLTNKETIKTKYENLLNVSQK